MKSMVEFVKRLGLAAVLGVASVSAYASEPYECYRKGMFALDLGVGTNIDLSSLNQEQKAVFEQRPKAVFQFSMRPSYYFSRHWGAYVDLSLSFFRLSDKERLVDVLMPGLSKLKPTFSLGGVYRYEYGAWQIWPRLGVGNVDYGRYRSRVERNGKEIEQKRTGSMWSVDAGVTTAFRTSRVSLPADKLNEVLEIIMRQ